MHRDLIHKPELWLAVAANYRQWRNWAVELSLTTESTYNESLCEIRLANDSVRIQYITNIEQSRGLSYTTVIIIGEGNSPQLVDDLIKNKRAYPQVTFA